jgi:hypothetical protein
MMCSCSTGVALQYMRRRHAGGLSTAVAFRQAASGIASDISGSFRHFPTGSVYMPQRATYVLACTCGDIVDGKTVFACTRSVGLNSRLDIPPEPDDRKVGAACHRQRDFGLRPHIIGNIPPLAEDRQKRPKVGSVLDALLGGLGYDDKQRRIENWPHH